jgi:ABC-type amino acid transport substrate-binding protein
MFSAIDSNKVDAIITDITDFWAYQHKYKLVKYISEKSIEKYGILFPKNSKYFKKFNEAFNYYVDSVKFLRLLRKHFGQEAVRFYNKSLSSH